MDLSNNINKNSVPSHHNNDNMGPSNNNKDDIPSKSNNINNISTIYGNKPQKNDTTESIIEKNQIEQKKEVINPFDSPLVIDKPSYYNPKPILDGIDPSSKLFKSLSSYIVANQPYIDTDFQANISSLSKDT